MVYINAIIYMYNKIVFLRRAHYARDNTTNDTEKHQT